MPRLKKSEMRLLVPAALVGHGFERIRARSSQGLLPGSRLEAAKGGELFDIAVKISTNRTLSITRKSEISWRTVTAVDLIVAVAPTSTGEEIEIFCFESEALIGAFNEAWQALKDAGRSLTFPMPVFVPLDRDSQKNLGHEVVDLKRLALWTERLDAVASKSGGSITRDELYARIKREIAEFNQVDVSQVELDIRLKI